MNARILIALALLLGACTPTGDAADSAPLTGARIGGPFSLVNQNGRRITDRDFAGRWRIMYFGYTFCPDVCPVDVQMLAAGLKAFERSDPARGGRVVPVFVTADPARDDPATLKAFTAAFHPRLVGLTGTEDEIAAVFKAYGAVRRLGPRQPGGGYLVDHSRQAYLMDPAGQPVALLPSEGPPQAIADELARWVR